MEVEQEVEENQEALVTTEVVEMDEEKEEDINAENEEAARQNPKTGDENSSDSDDDDDEEEESKQKEELMNLEYELSVNPSNYDLHVQYVKLLRRMGEIEKLRQAREAMSSIFPLSPAMWQEWIKDEASLSAGGEAFSIVENLYERGVSDYLAVSLWYDYLNYVQENDPSVCQCSPDGILKARNLFERALTSTGLHVAEGDQIWEAYRDFEQAILHTIDETDIQAKELQIQNVRSIFHRQLSVPLRNLKSTLLVYKAWEKEQGNIQNDESSDLEEVPSHVVSAYKKALEMYNARAQHEEQISKDDIPDTEKFQNFMSYLIFEKKEGDPTRVQSLYERAITAFPVTGDLWLDYTLYLDRTLKVGSVVRNVYSRAIRNCPWVGELWVHYLLSLERGQASEEEISTVFEKSLECTFSTLEEYLELYLTRVDGLRRRMVSGIKDISFSLIRDSFQRASDYLSPHMKNTESLLKLHSYWARLEANLGKDVAPARGVWDSFLKISGSMVEAWKGYAAMEIQWGNINAARSIYKRCYTKRFDGTGSEEICHSWLRFEREFGSLEDLDHAVQKVTPRLEELQLYRMQQESVVFAGSTNQMKIPVKKNARDKRKGDSTDADEQSPLKRQKQLHQSQKGGKEKNEVQSKRQESEAKEVESETDKTNKPHEKHTEESGTRRTKAHYTDQSTAFISNLDLKANYEDLRKFFSDVGGIADIRILHDRHTGKSRGLAYVEFVDDEHLQSAVAKNKQNLLGKKISIARSNPKQNRKDGHAGSRDHANHGGQQGGSSSISSKDSRLPRNQPPTTNRRDEKIELKGRNTFALPRNVKPLGWAENKPKPVNAEETKDDDKPKSNDEFRKMFMKS